jgi:predicted O-linked N-acetylglucosamine transferase (SPINDLY family)
MLRLELIKDEFRNGNHHKAIAACKEFIKASPRDANALKLLAKMYGLILDYKNAILISKKCLDLNQNDSEVIYNLAYFERQISHFYESEKWINIFLKLNPDSYEGWACLVEIYLRLQNHEESLKYSVKALQYAENEPGIYLSRAICLRNMKRYDEAIQELEISNRILPNSVEVMLEFGENYLELNRSDLADNYFQLAINIHPQNVQDLYLQTKVKLHLGKLEEALQDYEVLINHQYKLAEVHHLKAKLLMQLARYEEALLSLIKAEDLDSFDVLMSFGEYFYYTKNHIKALQYLNQYLAKRDKDAQAWMWKASNLLELNQIQDAVFCFIRVLQIDKDWPFALGFLLYQLQSLCDWETLDEKKELLKEALDSQKPAAMPFTVLSTFDDPEIQQKVALTYLKHFKDKNIVANLEFPRKNKEKQRIKIAYFSPDFGEHAVSYLAVELFELHNRDEFEVYAFSLLNKFQNNFKSRVINSFDNFIDVSSKSDDEIVQLARDYEIDIAIDLCGITANNRFNLFVRRIAPIQLGYLGYLGTTGNLVDYLFADHILIPEKNVRFFSEKIIYLPSYQVNDRRRRESNFDITRSDRGIPSNVFVYGCLSNSYKITPEIFKVWMQILLEVPQSVLVLSSPQPIVKANLFKEVKKYSINLNRIIFIDRCPREEYLTCLKLIDLFLDTPVYGAGTTASDALSMGVPVLTVLGESFPSRIASSVLTAFGMPELITASIDEYLSLAIDLGNNESEFHRVKYKTESLVDTCKLFDTPETTQNIEKAYKVIYQRYVDGMSPDHIEISD